MCCTTSFHLISWFLTLNFRTTSNTDNFLNIVYQFHYFVGHTVEPLNIYVFLSTTLVWFVCKMEVWVCGDLCTIIVFWEGDPTPSRVGLGTGEEVIGAVAFTAVGRVCVRVTTPDTERFGRGTWVRVNPTDPGVIPPASVIPFEVVIIPPARVIPLAVVPLLRDIPLGLARITLGVGLVWEMRLRPELTMLVNRPAKPRYRKINVKIKINYVKEFLPEK